MDYFLTISDEASENVKNIVTYLKKEWTRKSVLNFQKDLTICFQDLLLHPHDWLLVDKDREIRKYQISKHNSAFYRVKGKEIEIITVFDHRRNPDNLRELLRKLE